MQTASTFALRGKLHSCPKLVVKRSTSKIVTFYCTMLILWTVEESSIGLGFFGFGSGWAWILKNCRASIGPNAEAKLRFLLSDWVSAIAGKGKGAGKLVLST